MSNQNSYYIPAPSKRISVLFGSFFTKSLLCRVARSVVPRCDDPVHTRWASHQARIPVQTQTTTTLKQQQGHRVISEHSDEIVPRWVPHQYSITRTPLSSTSKYRLPLNHSPKLIYLDFLLESAISNAKCRWPKIK